MRFLSPLLDTMTREIVVSERRDEKQACDDEAMTLTNVDATQFLHPVGTL